MAGGNQDMDAIDRKIVALLQDDASLSLAQMARPMGPVWSEATLGYATDSSEQPILSLLSKRQ